MCRKLVNMNSQTRVVIIIEFGMIIRSTHSGAHHRTEKNHSHDYVYFSLVWLPYLQNNSVRAWTMVSYDLFGPISDVENALEAGTRQNRDIAIFPSCARDETMHTQIEY